MDEGAFQRALEFARSIRTDELSIGPTIAVGPTAFSGDLSEARSQDSEPSSTVQLSAETTEQTDNDFWDTATTPDKSREGQVPGQNQREELIYWLRELGPYRKGPFSFFGEQVASHWNSDAKWQHCRPFLESDPSVVSGDVLDLGCNNGYYLLRLLELKKTGTITGMDPARPFYQQFRFLQEMLGPEHPACSVRFIPCGHEGLKSDIPVPLSPESTGESGASWAMGAEKNEEPGISRTGREKREVGGAGSEKHRDSAISRTSGEKREGDSADSEKDRDSVISRTATEKVESDPADAEKDGQGGTSRTGDAGRREWNGEEVANTEFDAILCWGVIYHRTDPIELLRTIHGALRTGGMLYLESMAIPDDPAAPYPRAIVPSGKYAGARGIWHVPDAESLKNYLHRSGFRDIEILKQWDYAAELNPETGLPVLDEFLDPARPGFLKDGLPAPIRILVRARR